jgi:hypothetical protein
VRGDDVRRVRTERTEPAPRSATRDGPDATCVDSKIHAIDAAPDTGRHGVGLVVVVVDRLGGRRGRRSDGVEPLEGRARVPEPELDAGGLERRQRITCALRATGIREQRPGAVVRDGVLRRLELRFFLNRERREARGECAAVEQFDEQFDEREAAPAPVRTTVAAMASWWGKGRTVGSASRGRPLDRPGTTPRKQQDAGAIPADAAEPAPEARVLGARDGPHRGFARAARGLPVFGARRGDGRRGPGLRFFWRRIPPRWRGTRRNATSTPSPRR